MIEFVNFGENIDIEDLEKHVYEALVVKAVGIRSSWKTPVAYFLTAGISAAIQAQLLEESHY